jgi:hypothetical protein
MPAASACPDVACAAMCGEDFPAFDQGCSAPTDCVPVAHQADCCGTIAILGILQSEQRAFTANENACRAAFPDCDCAPMATTTEDGSTVAGIGEAMVRCTEAGTCESFAP